MSGSDQLCALPAPAADDNGPASDVFAQAVTSMGWGGVVIGDMTLFGQRVMVVAEVDARAHEERVASGWAPVTDRMSVALWDWPEHRDSMPPSAVSLRGVIARGQRWQRALAAAGGFVGFCSTAIMLDQEREPNQHCLMTAHLRGVAVLTLSRHGEAPVLAQAGRVGPVETARPSALSRWVEELVYARLLAGGLPTAQVTQ
jgi:hypothetical protein